MRKQKISDRAVDFILSRRNEELKDLQVDKIASVLGANCSYLSRSFKRNQKISVTEFILREKIHRAIFLIDDGCKKSVPELSNELGFLKVDDFIHEFKNHLAIEPEHYITLRMATIYRQVM